MNGRRLFLMEWRCGVAYIFIAQGLLCYEGVCACFFSFIPRCINRVVVLLWFCPRDRVMFLRRYDTFAARGKVLLLR
jgi:hypothetical protein